MSAAGRKTKYKPEFCDLLIDHMSRGLSYYAFAAEINVNRDTLYEWEKNYSDFKEAKSIGLTKSLLFWEKLGVDNILNVSESEFQGGSSSRSLNAATWIYNMNNRFRDFGWRNKHPEEQDNININLSLADKLSKARARSKSR